MPVQATALNFYRKRQTLETLSQERPQSLSSVYTVVREVVAAIEDRVRNLEASFYGHGGTQETEIRQWLVPLQLILRPARYSGLVNKQQLEEIYDRHIDITDIMEVDEPSLVQIQNLVAKNMKALREGFDESIQSVLTLTSYMSRYCLSFSSPQGDPYLETATNYEKQRRDLEKAIRLNTENIGTMADKFEFESLTVQQLDYPMKELAEKNRLDQSPVAILFPAACHNMRNALKGLLMWVDADSNYAEYLTYDIRELEGKKDSQAKIARESMIKANCGEFNVKTLKKEVTEASDLVKKLKTKEQTLKIAYKSAILDKQINHATLLSREASLNVMEVPITLSNKMKEERKLRDKNKDVLVDLDIKEYRRMEMKLNGSLTHREGVERYERLHSEIIDLQSRKPAIERRITDLERQQTWISGRNHHRHNKQTELDEASKELKASRRHARKMEVELERLQDCVAKLKEIHLLKISQETLKKIFHNMPINSKYAQPIRKKKDTLERLCKFTAADIEGDWIRLYRALPFYPTRGQETISADIDEIITRFLRNSEEQALQALSRWKRWHTRAGSDDLRQALIAIKRKDIVERYDAMLVPKIKVAAASPKAHRMVHFPKITPRTRKKNQKKTGHHQNHYLSFDS